jgi:hypothetical protein
MTYDTVTSQEPIPQEIRDAMGAFLKKKEITETVDYEGGYVTKRRVTEKRLFGKRETEECFAYALGKNFFLFYNSLSGSVFRISYAGLSAQDYEKSPENAILPAEGLTVARMVAGSAVEESLFLPIEDSGLGKALRSEIRKRVAEA